MSNRLTHFLEIFVALFPHIISYLEQIVTGLKEQFLSTKDELVLFWATKVPFCEDAINTGSFR